MSRAVVALSDLLERERNHVSDAHAAFRSAAGCGCLGEIDGQRYLRVLREYERHVRDSLESRGAGMSRPAVDAAARKAVETELEWIDAEKSRVLDCYGGILPDN
jgi:hypothetical protein